MPTATQKLTLPGLARASVEETGKLFAELEALALKDLREEGFDMGRVVIERALDLRYAGQGYEITVPVTYPLHANSLAELRRRFDETHKLMFGHTAPEEPVEIVSYRLQIGRAHV